MLKKAEEYLKEIINISQGGVHLDRGLNIIKQVQIDTIDATVKMCAENAKLLQQSNWGKYEQAGNDSNPNLKEIDVIKNNHFGHGDCTYEIIKVSKQSILQVAEKLKKEIE